MPIYRVKGNDAGCGRPVEMLVDAPDHASAQLVAERADMLSPRITEVASHEPFDPAAVVAFDPSLPAKVKPDMLRERPVLTIALGVFLGLLMFATLGLIFATLGSLDEVLRD